MLLDAPIRSHAEPTAVQADLVRTGLALVGGMAGPPDLLRLARSLGSVIRHRDSRHDGVTVIEDRGWQTPGLAGFTRCTLPPHTDGSGVAEPPDMLLTACGNEPLEGGQITLVDGRAVYDELAATAPEALDALHTPRSAMFGGADGYLGSVFTRAADGVVTVRLRLDALARFAPIVTPHLPALRAAIRLHTITLPAVTGTGYVLNNHRWLHGRLAYEGRRRMYRILVRPDRGRIPTGFESADGRKHGGAISDDSGPSPAIRSSR